MFIFSSFIVLYIAIFGYRFAKARFKQFETKPYEPYEPYEPPSLTKKECEHIRTNMLKSGLKHFPPSKALLEHDKSYFTSSTLSNLLESYKNIQEWSYEEVGDVLYILNIDPIKRTRSYSKNIKLFHILLDEFIYYAHYNLVAFKTQ